MYIPPLWRRTYVCAQSVLQEVALLRAVKTSARVEVVCGTEASFHPTEGIKSKRRLQKAMGAPHGVRIKAYSRLVCTASWGVGWT